MKAWLPKPSGPKPHPRFVQPSLSLGLSPNDNLFCSARLRMVPWWVIGKGDKSYLVVANRCSASDLSAKGNLRADDVAVCAVAILERVVGDKVVASAAINFRAAIAKRLLKLCVGRLASGADSPKIGLSVSKASRLIRRETSGVESGETARSDGASAKRTTRRK